MNTIENISATDSQGNIDRCKQGVLSGWFSSHGKSDALNLILQVNGVDTDLIATPKDRPDVMEAIGCEIDCGFEFDLSEIGGDTTVDIGVYHCSSAFDFRAKKHTYNYLIDKYSLVLSELLMPEYYRNRYTLSGLSNGEIKEHYLSTGIYKNLDPNPWFSSEYYQENYSELIDESGIAITSYLENESNLTVRASEIFDTKFYARKYTDQAKLGAQLLHYVQFGQYEGRMIQDCAPGESLRKQVLAACEIEPQCQKLLSKLNKTIRYPRIVPSLYAPLTLKHKYEDRIKVIVTVPFVSLGGADLISTFVLKALQESYSREEVLLLVTEHESVEVPDWIAESTSIEILNGLSRFRTEEHKMQALHTIVGLLSPEKLVNINSRATWELIKCYGKQLSTVLDLYAYLFCFDYDADRVRVGYITEYLPETIPHFEKILCDNSNIINEIEELYRFPSNYMEKLETVYVPLPQNMGSCLRKEDRKFKKKVLWIGRLSEQKRPDLLVEIASSLKDYQFHVYGPAGNSSCSDAIVNGDYKNIHYHGVYVHLAELDVNDYDLYLNTSEWEGLPTIIMQIMALGLPIITSNAGGIEELVDDKTGTVVKNAEDVDAYVRSVLCLRANYEEACRKSEEGFIKVSRQHSWEHFYSKLQQIGLVGNSAHSNSAGVGEVHDTQELDSIRLIA